MGINFGDEDAAWGDFDGEPWTVNEGQPDLHESTEQLPAPTTPKEPPRGGLGDPWSFTPYEQSLAGYSRNTDPIPPQPADNHQPLDPSKTAAVPVAGPWVPGKNYDKRYVLVVFYIWSFQGHYWHVMQTVHWQCIIE